MIENAKQNLKRLAKETPETTRTTTTKTETELMLNKDKLTDVIMY